jgi:hypothetical protein
MPKVWVSQDCDDVQALRVNSSSRYIYVIDSAWQPLFAYDATLAPPVRTFKLAAELDTTTFQKLRVIAYIYNETTNSVDSASSVSFSLYSVNQPGWIDTFESTLTGVEQSNAYFFVEINISDFISGLYNGDTTLMVEATATRLSSTYRNRIYINHLGIYSSFTKLKKFVDYLDITKLDE